MVTLLCPEGAWDYPISNGTQSFFPYRADITSLDRREYGGPWLVDVPDDVAHYYIKAGFVLMSEDRQPGPAGPMVRLRKIDGGDPSCAFRGEGYVAEKDGTVLVPAEAVGELVESHGFESVPDPSVAEVSSADPPPPDHTPPSGPVPAPGTPMPPIEPEPPADTTPPPDKPDPKPVPAPGAPKPPLDPSPRPAPTPTPPRR